jgi:hypothetical protein
LSLGIAARKGDTSTIVRRFTMMVRQLAKDEFAR